MGMLPFPRQKPSGRTKDGGVETGGVGMWGPGVREEKGPGLMKWVDHGVTGPPCGDRATEQGRLVDEGRAPGSLDFILMEVSWECHGRKMAWTTLYIKNISPEE